MRYALTFAQRNVLRKSETDKSRIEKTAFNFFNITLMYCTYVFIYIC